MLIACLARVAIDRDLVEASQTDEELQDEVHQELQEGLQELLLDRAVFLYCVDVFGFRRIILRTTQSATVLYCGVCGDSVFVENPAALEQQFFSRHPGIDILVLLFIAQVQDC